jgi:WASH complex subunit strumpellin
VAKYYSSQLFNFIKSVLYIIPVNIFKQLDGISTILQLEVEEFEVKIAKTLLKEKAAFQSRFKLAQKTHEVVLFTEGMLVLDKVLMGVIEIDPKEILVDGLRKELSKKLAGMLHKGFIFDKDILKAHRDGKPLPEGT